MKRRPVYPPRSQTTASLSIVWRSAVFVALAGLAVFAAFLLIRSRPNFDGVMARGGYVSLEQVDGRPMEIVNRRTGPELWFCVTLDQVPQGIRIPLECEWVDPDSQIVHRNDYQTRPSTESTISTHARYQLVPNAKLGGWTVRLKLHGRLLDSVNFQLFDDPGDPRGSSDTTLRRPPKEK